jgi:biopolymer transport protein ExbB/TolQ
VLRIWARRDLRGIAASMDDFTRGLKHRSLFAMTGHLSDQIDAFIADVNDVLSDPSRKAERKALLERMSILDERRRYLGSLWFETVYNIWRTMIEAYPMAGVLGTILAIGAALQSGPDTTVSSILGRFGEAIWATFAGLFAAILLMLLNSVVEPGFNRLSENRTHVREMVARAKRELSLSSGDGA